MSTFALRTDRQTNYILTKRQRYQSVIAWFAEHAESAETELQYTTPFELLVAVVLSAQCTDKRVNMVTPRLFMHYPTAEAMHKASEDEIFELISSISYPRSKAKHLVGLSRMLQEEYGGQVPQGREALMRLPGVGRKTANVISAVIYNEPTMAVDTHVFRVSERIGLTTRSKTPLETELELLKYIPQELIPKAHHWLILHGRYVCLARKPKCSSCGLTPWCRYAQKAERKAQRQQATSATNKS